MYILRILLFFFLIVLKTNLILCQSFDDSQENDKKPEKKYNNSHVNNFFYLEAGLFGYGANYEHMLSENASIRFGVNFSTTLDLGGGTSHRTHAFPVMLNLMSEGKNKLEIGVGVGPYYIENRDNSEFKPAVQVGYRYQQEKPGFFFRCGIGYPSNLILIHLGFGMGF
jgi:hypothetical protein